MGAEIVVAKEVTDLTKEAMHCMKEYAVCKQEEITERTRIKAQMTTLIRLIDSNKEMFLEALEKDAKERNRIYDMASRVIELAAKNGYLDMVEKMSDMVMKTYQETPRIDINQVKLLDGKPM